jgi:CheY-like chemotaxis protein
MEDRKDHLRDTCILVVEDDNDTREMLKFILEKSGAAVVSAASFREAMEAYHKIEPDVVITDIAMPDLNGYALITRIRDEEKNLGKMTPAIALTAYTSSADRKQALAAGFQQYIAKPFNPAKLISTVAKLVHREGPEGSKSPAA